MPIYEYRCDDCESLFEVMQKMSDPPLEVCERCGGRLRKVLHPVAIHFKGSGFYTTDYGRGSSHRPPKESVESAQKADEGAGPESGSTAAAKSEEKSVVTTDKAAASRAS